MRHGEDSNEMLNSHWLMETGGRAWLSESPNST